MKKICWSMEHTFAMARVSKYAMKYENAKIHAASNNHRIDCGR
jgi:hypothetical protein